MGAVTIIQLSPEQLQETIEQAVQSAIEKTSRTSADTWSQLDVANYLGVSIATVRRMEIDGRLPPRIGRRWEKAGLLRFLRERAHNGHKK